ncbi:TonB-dependent receptor, partial [Phascolarctobacterium succinatutens]
DQISGFTSPNSPTDINYTGAGDFSDHPGELYSLNIEKAWENVGNHTILVGGNYKQEEMIQHRFNLSKWHDRDSKINEYATDSGKVKNTALFVQDEYKMNDKVTMYAGLRYDNYKKGDGHFWKDGAYDTTSKGESYNELSPKLAFDFKADENTNYYVSYGHSFNPGPMYQIYRYGGSGMGAVIPNPALDPETSDTFEVGMKQKLSDNTKFGINLYRIETKDKIAYTYFYNAAGVCTHKQYINYNEEKRRGVEFELNHKFDSNWSAYLNYAWQTGKTSGAVIPGTNKNQAYSGVADYTVPKHLLHSGIEYRNDKLNVLLDCQYVSERMSPDSATGEYGAEDAFFIVNTGLNYKLAKDVTLQFGITNLLDKEFYCSEATAGRTYNVGLRYSF